MSVDGSLEEWMAFATPLPWGLAFEPATKTYRIVAHTPEGSPRLSPSGDQVIVAQGLTQPDALVLIALRERYRRSDKAAARGPNPLRLVE
jgi:hypothetical protein